MTAQALTTRQLNRALLARQLLLERSPLAIPAALDQLGGIQNQSDGTRRSTPRPAECTS